MTVEEHLRRHQELSGFIPRTDSLPSDRTTHETLGSTPPSTGASERQPKALKERVVSTVPEYD